MDVERVLQVVVEQQANFINDLTELRALVTRVAQQQSDLTQIVANIAGTQDEFGGALLAIAENQKQLAESHRQTEEELRQMGEKINQLGEKVNHMGEKLDALIDIVDGMIRRRGEQKGS